MHFIRDKALAKRFRENKVPSRERLIYLLITELLSIFFILNTITTWMHASAKVNKWSFIQDALIIITTFFGILWLYKTNTKGDNKEFIERYICLGFPVLIQCMLISTLFYVLAVISYILFNLELPLETSPLDVCITTLSLLYYFYRLSQGIKIASGQS